MHEGEPGTNGRAAGPVDDPVAALEARLGLTLVDRAVALAALTHKSYVNEHREDALQDNERLEFLGDAVIDLAVSHRLMERFPAAREGDLSKMRAAVVDEQGLADMARALDLGSLLRLGRGEELTGGRAKASLLADAMEAVIAAVYHGQGLEAVLSVIDRFLGEAFARAAAGTLDRDFKTQLQELAQSRLRVTPRYRVVAEHGPDHSKVFEVEVDLRGEVLGRGRGRSKKDSEQAAARLALDALGRKLGADVAVAPCGPPEAPGEVAQRAPEGGAVLAGDGAEGEVGARAEDVASGPRAGPSPAGAGPEAPGGSPEAPGGAELGAQADPGRGAGGDAERTPEAATPAAVSHADIAPEDPAAAAPEKPAARRAAPQGRATTAREKPSASRPAQGEPPGAAAAPGPRPRKRAPAAKRPPRRSAPATRRTGAKQRSTDATRGVARPARKGSRARR